MAHSALARCWDDKRPAFGGWLTENSAAALDAYGQAGFDYVGIDCQHALLDETELARMLDRMRDTPYAVLTRASTNAPAPIGKLLDAGSDGVIVPGVNSRAEAEAAVSACRYPPNGTRSLGPIRAGLGRTPQEIEQRALCIVMIETAPGLENLDAICAVPGLSGIYIGPADLSLGLGMDPGGAFSTEQLATVFARIRAACDANGLRLGSHALDVAYARQCVAWGCDFVTVGTNGLLLAQASRSIVQQLRG